MKMPLFIKTKVKKMLHSMGYEVHIHRSENTMDCSLYELVRPFATYAPWNGDKMFLETYRMIQSSTLVDKYRCFELWRLVEQSKKLDGSLIEIGVWRGGTGALIARKAHLSGIVDTVYLCDTFSGVVKASDKDSSYKGGEHADTTQQKVEELLEELGLTNVTILEGVFPEQTAHLIKEDRFRFCHVDVDVYQSARDITDWIWPKMTIGGIVVYDDYGFRGCDGVTEHINEQIPDLDRIVLHNLNGHAVVIKIR
jgi:O-methyltransferase